jgi:antitoxin VapB
MVDSLEDISVALNIKNPAAEKLAREVAGQTGESLTEAIQRSLEERLERLKGRRSAPDLVETLLAISRRCSSLPDLDSRKADEILGYDEHGAFG